MRTATSYIFSTLLELSMIMYSRFSPLALSSQLLLARNTNLNERSCFSARFISGNNYCTAYFARPNGKVFHSS